MAVDDGLEAALATTEEQVDTTLRAAAALTRELKKAKAGAARGQLRDLRRALDSVATLSTDLAASAERTSTSFDLDEQEYLASGSFTKELLSEAANRDVAMFEADERLLDPFPLGCPPSIVIFSGALTSISERIFSITLIN